MTCCSVQFWLKTWWLSWNRSNLKSKWPFQQSVTLEIKTVLFASLLFTLNLSTLLLAFIKGPPLCKAILTITYGWFVIQELFQNFFSPSRTDLNGMKLLFPNCWGFWHLFSFLTLIKINSAKIFRKILSCPNCLLDLVLDNSLFLYCLSIAHLFELIQTVSQNLQIKSFSK